MIIRIEISNETLQAINDGRNLAGSIKLNEPSKGKKSAPYVFKQFNRRGQCMKDKLIRVLEHGWVKESVQRIKVYESIPKALGNARVADVLARETEDAIESIENHRIINY